MKGNIELNYNLGNYAVDFDGKRSSPLCYAFYLLIRNSSTCREHDHVVQYRSLRFGHMRKSTLLCSTLEERPKSRTTHNERALCIFTSKERFLLALQLFKTKHAQRDVVVFGRNHTGTQHH